MNHNTAYTIASIAGIIKGRIVNAAAESRVIDQLVPDSRKILFPASSLFFTLDGPRRSGKQFIRDAYVKGVRGFVVSGWDFDIISFPGSSFIIVDDVLKSLQELVSYHRQRFSLPVIGITGSNGKTIVKEWLFQLLQQDHHIIRSPKSYNSQTGVPLSVWQLDNHHDLAIFEAGISKKGEMERLQNIILPTIGIFTSLGDAHDEGFSSPREKIAEKIKLFRGCKNVIYCRDYELVHEEMLLLKNEKEPIELFGWSRNDVHSILYIERTEKQLRHTVIYYKYANGSHSATINFTDIASVENSITCLAMLLQLGLLPGEIAERLQLLKPVEMRLELKQGINDCSIINDSYSADLSSLSIALDFLEQQKQHRKHTLIVSDILESGKSPAELYLELAGMLEKKNISRIIAIGPGISAFRNSFRNIPESEFFLSTRECKEQFHTLGFNHETILLKGARVFEFEDLSKMLEQKMHQTVLEIDLAAMLHNLQEYQKLLQPATRLMVMVKAASYGSGSFEIANLLQFHKIDYLAVAYADEGIELRKAGISLPIMIMSPEESTFEALIKYDLQPELFSFEILDAFISYVLQSGVPHFPVHIKLDTGMHRLGFEAEDMQQLGERIKANSVLKVQSVFSHLAASDDNQETEFTRKQLKLFLASCSTLQSLIGYEFLKHIANSAAISGHPEMHLDMVRLGIGLYGVDGNQNMQPKLKNVTTLRSTIAQIRKVKAGESIGYGRKAIMEIDSTVATVRVGYADGYPRSLGNNKGKMLLGDNLVPVVGNVCMDMTMLDITGIESIKVGDEVIVFGEKLPVTLVAQWADTISYEIMTGISQRVKRIYYEG